MDAGATRQAAGAELEAERRAVLTRHVERAHHLEVKGRRHHLLWGADLEDRGLRRKCEQIQADIDRCLRLVVEHQELIAVADRPSVIDDLIGDHFPGALPIEIRDELQRCVAAERRRKLKVGRLKTLTRTGMNEPLSSNTERDDGRAES